MDKLKKQRASHDGIASGADGRHRGRRRASPVHEMHGWWPVAAERPCRGARARQLHGNGSNRGRQRVGWPAAGSRARTTRSRCTGGRGAGARAGSEVRLATSCSIASLRGGRDERAAPAPVALAVKVHGRAVGREWPLPAMPPRPAPGSTCARRWRSRCSCSGRRGAVATGLAIHLAAPGLCAVILPRRGSATCTGSAR